MGVFASLGGAFSWAFASTLLASQARKVDSLSASALRVSAAMVFLLLMLFILGSQGDIGRMSAWDILQLLGNGLLNLTIGESLYAAAVASIGLTRTLTTVIGTNNLSALLLAAVLLGESVTSSIILGVLLVGTGLCLVAGGKRG